MRTFVVLLVAAAACSPTVGKQAAVDVEHSGRVRDVADIMTAATEQRIEAELSRLEAATTDQVGVVTIPSLAGQPIDRFALDYARRWQLGQKDVDNGVLVLVAPKERKVRIEVGYGLEGLLTDKRAATIVRQMMVPFRDDNYDAGIELGVGEIDKLLLANRKRPQRLRQPMRKAS